MWHKAVGVLAATLDSLAVHFPNKEVMIVETAAYYRTRMTDGQKVRTNIPSFIRSVQKGNVSSLVSW